MRVVLWSVPGLKNRRHSSAEKSLYQCGCVFPEDDICPVSVWLTLWSRQQLWQPSWRLCSEWLPRLHLCDPGTFLSSPLCLPGATWAFHLTTHRGFTLETKLLYSLLWELAGVNHLLTPCSCVDLTHSLNHSPTPLRAFMCACMSVFLFSFLSGYQCFSLFTSGRSKQLAFTLANPLQDGLYHLFHFLLPDTAWCHSSVHLLTNIVNTASSVLLSL